jgi:hypothetical protein
MNSQTMNQEARTALKDAYRSIADFLEIVDKTPETEIAIRSAVLAAEHITISLRHYEM